MDRSPRSPFTGLVTLVTLLLTLPQLSFAKSVAYCSTQNTSDFEKLHWPWQSQGWCNDACKGDHPYGITQGEYCWCSDYAPIDQGSVSDCSDSCPGYPDEKCGNLQENLFLYVRLDSTAKVKGTKGASQPTSSSNPPAASSTLHTTAIPNSDPPPAVTSVQVITVSGVVVTQTVITGPTSTVAAQASKKTSTGAIVGGVVGGIAVLCAIAGAVIFTLWRRRRQQHQEDGTGQSGVQRNTSNMSRNPFGSGPQYPPAIATSYNGRSSRILDTDSISPISVSDRRSSRLVFDQRLNPSAIMVLDNPSRDSFASMDDSRDYGRTLNVRNPDPNP